MNPDTEAQLELEKLFHKNQLLPRLRREMRNETVIKILTSYQIPIDFGIDLFVQMVIHRRANIATLVGLLHHHFGNDTGSEKALQSCADMITYVGAIGLIKWNPSDRKFSVIIDITPEMKAELELYQYPLPMVVPPNQVTHNKETGYLTHRESIILKQGNHHDKDVCLDHINRVNQTRLTINVDTARMVHNRWQNLDRQKEDETRQQYEQRLKAFLKYDRNAKAVMEHIFVVGDRFWLTHRYDKRGRTYAQGYHVNPQGTAWNKAVIEFADKEIVQ